MNDLPLGSRLTQGLLVLIAAILAVHFLRIASPVVLPFLAALMLSFFANPIVEGVSRRHVPAWAAILGVVLLISVALAALGLLLQISVNELVDNADLYRERATHLWNNVVSRVGMSKHDVEQNLGSQLKSTGPGFVAAGVGSLLDFLENLILVLVYMVFLLAGRRTLPARLDKAFGPDQRRKMLAILYDIESQSLRYIGLRTVLCILTGVVVWGIVALYGVEFAVLIGVLTFVAQYVPILGPVVASIVPVGIALIQFPSPLTAVWIFLWLAAWHLLVGYLIEPRVFGRGMHLSQVLILLGLLFFAWMWGAAGAVLAVPLLVVLKAICDNLRPLKPVAVLLGGG